VLLSPLPVVGTCWIPFLAGVHQSSDVAVRRIACGSCEQKRMAAQAPRIGRSYPRC